MIKDKITPALKEKFRQTIDKTIDSGKDQGFFICSDKQGSLYPSKSCEGEECQILEDQSSICPVRLQGDFHTRSYLANAKSKYKEIGKEVPIDDVLKQEIRKSLTEMHEEKGVVGISPIVPDYKDSLFTIVNKCFRNTDVSTCIGSDLDKNKIECWTPKDIRKGQCVRAAFDFRNIVGKKKEFFPKKWVVPLFDKEQITI
jgi:hypothetical protein